MYEVKLRVISVIWPNECEISHRIAMVTGRLAE
jgi:hypothetical protein